MDKLLFNLNRQANTGFWFHNKIINGKQKRFPVVMSSQIILIVFYRSHIPNICINLATRILNSV